jgi:hypothetical protein
MAERPPARNIRNARIRIAGFDTRLFGKALADIFFFSPARPLPYA